MNWGALWDWIGKIEPGTWSEWVGSILTGGSLLLGFSILRGDRLKDKRLQAYKVLAYFEEDHRLDYSTNIRRNLSSIHINNTSALPIFDLNLTLWPRSWLFRSPIHWSVHGRPFHSFKLFSLETYQPTSLKEGDTWINPLPFDRSQATFYKVIIMFKDSEGVRHQRQGGLETRQRFMGRVSTTFYIRGALAYALEFLLFKARRASTPHMEMRGEYRLERAGRYFRRMREREILDGEWRRTGKFSDDDGT